MLVQNCEVQKLNKQHKHAFGANCHIFCTDFTVISSHTHVTYNLINLPASDHHIVIVCNYLEIKHLTLIYLDSTDHKRLFSESGQASAPPIPASQSNILSAAEQLPTHSDLIIVSSKLHQTLWVSEKRGTYLFTQSRQ